MAKQPQQRERSEYTQRPRRGLGDWDDGGLKKVRRNDDVWKHAARQFELHNVGSSKLFEWNPGQLRAPGHPIPGHHLHVRKGIRRNIRNRHPYDASDGTVRGVLQRHSNRRQAGEIVPNEHLRPKSPAGQRTIDRTNSSPRRTIVEKELSLTVSMQWAADKTRNDQQCLIQNNYPSGI